MSRLHLLACTLALLAVGGHADGAKDTATTGAGQAKDAAGSSSGGGSDNKDQKIVRGPKLPGEDGYWLFLSYLSPSEGAFRPKFTEDGSDYAVTVDNPLVRSITFTLGLNVRKYDLMFCPTITVDGNVVEYSPLEPVTVQVWLNETIGPVDRVVRIKVADPKGVGGWFGLHQERAHQYNIRIRQPPEFDKVVRAQSIVVTSSQGEIVKGKPEFKPDSDKVQYFFPVNETLEQVTVKVTCTDVATSKSYNAEVVDKNADIVVSMKSASVTVLAQCIYNDPTWTKNVVMQRTYEVKLSKDAKIAKNPVELMMMPEIGVCSSKDGEFLCKSLTHKPELVALFDDEKTSVEIAHVPDDGFGSQFLRGIPTEVDMAGTQRQQFSLKVVAGDATVEIPLTVLVPDTCDHAPCGGSQINVVKKEKASEENAIKWLEHMCASDKCTEEDQSVCCRPRATCTALPDGCGAGKLLRAQKLCKGVTCEPEDFDTCCESTVSCTTFSFGCGVGRTIRPGAFCASDKCTPEDTDTCCQGGTACTAGYSGCPGGMAPRPDGFCRNVECTPEDKDVCCNLQASCATDFFSCGEGWVLRPDNLCVGAVCAPEDHTNCCVQRSSCVSFNFSCGFGMTLRPEGICQGADCSPEDRHVCCQPAESCSGFVLNCSGHRVSRPAGEEYCAGTHCIIEDEFRCCTEPANCTNFKLDCGVGKTPRPEGFCSGLECDEKDHEQCCQPTAKCDTYGDCGIGWTQKHAGRCKGLVCDDKDFLTCCEPAAVCTSYSWECPAGLTARPDGFCGGTECKKKEDQAACCQPAASCDLDFFSCPEGKTHRPNGWCRGLTCTPQDQSTCCAPRASCKSFVFGCDDRQVPRLEGNCQGLHCAQEDRHACCQPAAKCTEFKCGSGKVVRSGATCSGAKCTREDEGDCCEPAAKCDQSLCPDGFIVRKFAFCKGLNCTTQDEPTCCKPLAPCTTLEAGCGHGHVLRPGAFCSETTCKNKDRATCCEPAGKCQQSLCDEGFVVRSHSLCSGASCTQEDESKCCEPLAMCGSFTFNCGLGHTLRHDALCHRAKCNGQDTATCCVPLGKCSDVKCEPGYSQKQHTSFCEGANCTAEDHQRCCELNPTCSTFDFDCQPGHELRPHERCLGRNCSHSDYDICCPAVVLVADNHPEIVDEEHADGSHDYFYSYRVREKLAFYYLMGCSPVPGICRPALPEDERPPDDLFHGKKPEPELVRSLPVVMPRPELEWLSKVPKCYYDDACIQTPGLGCNANEHRRCRYCGFDKYIPCPEVHDCGDMQLGSWSTAKTKWCCFNFRMGCDPPYTCDDSKVTDWTFGKKAWCCRRHGKGCKFNCADGRDPVTWTQEQRDFCLEQPGDSDEVNADFVRKNLLQESPRADVDVPRAASPWVVAAVTLSFAALAVSRRSGCPRPFSSQGHRECASLAEYLERPDGSQLRSLCIGPSDVEAPE